MPSKIITKSQNSFSIEVAPFYAASFKNLEKSDSSKIIQLLKSLSRENLYKDTRQNPDFTYHDLRKLNAIQKLDPRCVLVKLNSSWSRIDFLFDDNKDTIQIQGIIFNIKPRIKKRNLRKKISTSFCLLFFLRVYLYFRQ